MCSTKQGQWKEVCVFQMIGWQAVSLEDIFHTDEFTMMGHFCLWGQRQAQGHTAIEEEHWDLNPGLPSKVFFFFNSFILRQKPGACLFVNILKPVLFSYNSNTIQVIHLTCAIQWMLVYSQSCAAIITIKFRKFHHPQKTPFTYQQLLPISLQLSLHSSLRQPLIYFLY